MPAIERDERVISVLLDVDRWDAASAAEQDAAIEEVARRLGERFVWLQTERYGVRRTRVVEEVCPACDGHGGMRAAAGTDAEYPDCEACGNDHIVGRKVVTDTSPEHRIATFRYRSNGLALLLVPGRLEIAPFLLARERT